MTNSRKIDLLYSIAKGRPVNISADERKELRKYRVDASGEYEYYTTKKNITAYVAAVDKGSTRLPFRDWCLNHGYADRRRWGSDKASVQKRSLRNVLSCGAKGALFWAICIGTITGDLMGSLIPAFLIATFFCCISRKYVAFFDGCLPIAIAILYCVLTYQ